MDRPELREAFTRLLGHYGDKRISEAGKIILEISKERNLLANNY